MSLSFVVCPYPFLWALLPGKSFYDPGGYIGAGRLFSELFWTWNGFQLRFTGICQTGKCSFIETL